ncbi:MAG: DUF4401 domain-containing protein, partial [Proteobacteria bacterium]|nr:DUF4401 domain-containing protein [Pseudomonadota bacterium]
MNTQNLWEVLTHNNLTQGEKPQTDTVFIPWYIRFIQGTAGWLASIFILVFFAIAFNLIFSQPSASLVLTLGALCSLGGYVLIKMLKNDFVEQLGMAFSLCGQILVAFGIFFVLKLDFTVAAFIFASYQLFLAWLIPQYIHRLLSTAFGLFALLLALNSYGIYGIGSALVAVLFSFIWMKENNWGKLREFFEPVGLGVAFTLVFSNGYLVTETYFLQDLFRNSSSNHNNTGWFFQNSALISGILISLVFLYVVVSLLKEYKIKFDSRTAIVSFIAVAGLLLISLKISGISTGLLIALVGFARQRMVLIVLGIVSVISFFSWYYYNLNITLLYKSIVLIVLGIALLSSWLAIKYLYKDKSSNSTAR